MVTHRWICANYTHYTKRIASSMALKRWNRNHTSQPLIHQFLKKSKQNRKVSIANSTKISSHTALIPHCPVCNKNLHGLSTSNRSNHINMCLDFTDHPPSNIHISNTTNSVPHYMKKTLRSPSLKRSHSYHSYHTGRCNRNYNTKLNRYFTSKSTTRINVFHPAPCTKSKVSPLQFYTQYKILDKSNIVVDGFSNHFRYAPNNAVYFLTHFHSDHYKGLTDKFRHGAVYCSEITSRLVYSQIGDQVPLKPLPMFERCLVEESAPQTFVTLLEANHCPGAVMFLFEMHCDDGVRYHLHCGDARCEFETDSILNKCEFHLRNNHILSKCEIDKLYLDTTYLEDKIDLPRQSDAVQFIVDKCKQYLQDYNDDIVILIGTYSIGKERILKEVAAQCNKLIYISERKQNIFKAVYTENENGLNIFTDDESRTNIRVVAMNEITFGTMWRYKKTDRTQVIGFKPTGWTSKGFQHIKKERKHAIYPIHQDSMTIYHVPYSEHSSFTELCKFVNDINAKEIVPTVNNRTPLQVQRQIESLDKYKDSIEYEYHDLIEDGGRKQQTLESYNFVCYQPTKQSVTHNL